jgi:thiazole/oxazole-forming peptide maturase SagD family component
VTHQATTTLSTITFDASLCGAANSALRKQLLQSASEGADARMHVTTLFDLPPNLRTGEPMTWLLLDYHRILLYREPCSSGGTGIDSVVQTLVEDYPLAARKAIKRHLREFGYKCLYPPSLFGFILRLSDGLRSGDLLAFDFLTGEIRRSHPQPHPDVVRQAPQTSSKISPAATTLSFPLSFTGPTLRMAGPVHRDAWISRDIGVIREERLHLWSGPFPSAVARSASPTPSQASITGGKSLHARTALHIAHCEALERFQLTYPRPDEPLIYGSYSSLRSYAIDPSLLFMGLGIPGERDQEPWTELSELYWTWAHQPSMGARCLVPAQSIWFTSRLDGEHVYALNSTSGCALGSCSTEAAVFALLEIIERDAYLVMWYLRRRCKKIRPSSLRSEQFQLLWEKARREFPAYEFHILDLRCDLPIPVVAVVASREQGEGPRTVHAAAARLTAENAAAKAMQDVLIELAHTQQQSQNLPREVGSRPEGHMIRGPEDHRALYYLDSSFERLSFFPFETEPQLDASEINLANPVRCGSPCELRHVLDGLVACLRDIEISPWFKDITHPFCSDEEIQCVRVITPGMFPLWFGERPQVDLTQRLQKLAVSLTSRSLSTIEEVNLYPHPFS